MNDIVKGCKIWADIATGKIPIAEVTDEEWELAILAQGFRIKVKL